MNLINFGTRTELEAAGRLTKELPNCCLVLLNHPELSCVELPDASAATRDTSDLAAAPGARTHRVIADSDGTLWVYYVPKHAPVIDKSAGPKPGADAAQAQDAAAAAGPPPQPLAPFAGLDRKALPPSPARPFSLQPSPVKPSPLKERVDAATAAVATKAWGARQARMSAMFGGKPPAGAAPGAAQPADAPAEGAGAMAPPLPRPVVPGGIAVGDMDF